MAVMTPFYAEKCCHLVNAHTVSAQRICSGVRHFPLHSSRWRDSLVVSVLD